jgi:decaprenylphospho-beta-D-erythro-pentofuranosid-2-ulose 2-reductase
VIDATGAPQSLALLGGTSDIGLAVAEKLARGRIRRVVLAGRDTNTLDAAAQRVRSAGATSVSTMIFEATATATHPQLVEDLFADGDLDVVVLAFGVLGDQADMLADPDKAVALAEVNFVGALSLGLRVAARLRQQGHGRLVVLSSVAADRARRSNFIYGSTKAGLDAFAQGLADELWGSGVGVVLVRPGFVHTKMTAGLAAAPFATGPDEVAQAIVGALRSRRRIVYVPAVLRPVMSAVRHLPQSVMRKLDM